MLRTLGRDQHVTEVAWAAPSGQGNPYCRRTIPHIVRRCDKAKGFVVLPERWIVERTIGWLNRCRRLAMDWKTSPTPRLPSSASRPSVSCSENS